MKKAFTLAEAIITVVVMGVILAMTLPTILKDAKLNKPKATEKQCCPCSYDYDFTKQ